MENKIYYIYHIPTFRHKDGRIGKIGCTEEEDAKVRVQNQGYTEYEILETHTDIMVASDREIELQKEYGYPVDKVPYYVSKKNRKKFTKEEQIKGGKTNVKSGHLQSISSKGGIASSNKNIKSGELKKRGENGNAKTAIAVIVYLQDGTYVGSYKSIQECARYLKLHGPNIHNVIKGKSIHTKGYVIKKNPNEGET